MKLVVTLLIAGLSLLARAAPASDCPVSCPNTSGPCVGGTGHVTVDCAGGICTVKLVLIAAGSGNVVKVTRGAGDASAVQVCVPPGGSTCCMTIFLNADCTWGDVGLGKCSCISVECL
jgi:hypothetical protein